MFELPDFAELTERAHVVSLPMRVKFRGVEHREALLLEGPAGWGEYSPFLEYAPAEAASWLASAIEAAWWGYPEPVRDVIPVNATLPAVGTERIAQVLSNYDAVHTIKVKVAERGQDLAQDVARVAEVRRLFPDAHIRIDANAGWTFEEATLALEALAGFGLQYAEQPVASIEELARLRKHVQARELGVLIAADESVRKEEDPLAVARAGAADLIVIKAQPLGGVRRALEIVAQAGLPAVVSSALDTSIGLRQGAGTCRGPARTALCLRACHRFAACRGRHDRQVPRRRRRVATARHRGGSRPAAGPRSGSRTPALVDGPHAGKPPST